MGIGAIVGAVAGGVGNYFAAKSAQKQANKNQRRAEQHEINILKNQVQWRTQDAIAAGLHPLAALGLNPASSGAGAGQVFGGPDYQAMGSDIGRAIDSMARPDQKAATAALQLGMEKVSLENEYTKTQIASQRMRNMQQATPGVSGPVDPNINGKLASDVTIPIPGFGIDIPVNNPNAAQEASNHWGEGGENVIGALGALNDVDKYLGLEAAILGSSGSNQLGQYVRSLINDTPMAADVRKGGYRSRYLKKKGGER